MHLNRGFGKCGDVWLRMRESMTPVVPWYGFLDGIPPLDSVGLMKSIRMFFRISSLSAMAMAFAAVLHADPRPSS
jgi:hypothetical protein